jgi:pimeloyl-ACP methyl ester carboxylesterase
VDVRTGGPFPPDPAERRGAIVLVHGAWVGEWCWAPLVPRLAATGRAVHAVSLTGHGTKRHQSGPHVTLADHVDDVVSVVDTFGLEEVVLVGHSYGGRVITAAFDRVADRIARIVYVDAHAPLAPDAGQSSERIAAAAASGGMLPFSDEYAVRPEHVGGEAGVAWFMDRVVEQSFATFTVPMTGDLPSDLRKAYVFCTGYGPSRFADYAAGARRRDDWEYHELAADHWPMYSHPAELTDIIVG